MEPLVLAAAKLTLGAVLLGTAVPWIGRQAIMLSVVALGVLSTGIAYVLNYRLIQDEGPTAASMTNYLTPVVAVLLGIAFVVERLTWNLIIGTAMILVGLWIAEHTSDEREVASDTLRISEDRVRGMWSDRSNKVQAGQVGRRFWSVPPGSVQ
jgi:drug/metabolite transporter (DMT)-like permease